MMKLCSHCSVSFCCLFIYYKQQKSCVNLGNICRKKLATDVSVSGRWHVQEILLRKQIVNADVFR